MASQLASREWLLVPEAARVTRVIPGGDHEYDLLNLRINRAIYYSERRFGINLDWTDPARTSNVRFRRQSGDSGAVTFDEDVAIHVRNGGWLCYRTRDVGINLGWSDNPKFEWTFGGGNGDITLPNPVSLFSNRANDYLIYQTRDWGINLRWSEDRDEPSWQNIVGAGQKARDLWNRIF